MYTLSVIALSASLLGLQDPQIRLNPEMCEQRALQLLADPTATAKFDSYQPLTFSGYRSVDGHVKVRTKTKTGFIAIDTIDGSIRSFSLNTIGRIRKSEIPVGERLVYSEAVRIAFDFAAKAIPGFNGSQWRVVLPGISWNGNSYTVDIQKVLNKYGALHPADIDILIDGETGEVYGFIQHVLYVMPEPPAPRVTREQAVEAATTYSRWDTGSSPFNDVILEASINQFGIVTSRWQITQYQIKQPGDIYACNFHYVMINAYDARKAWVPSSVDGPNSASSKPPIVREPHLLTLNLTPPRTGAGDNMFIKDGVFYMRVEWLRKFGAKVDLKDKVNFVSLKGKTITGDELQPRKGYGGWYVPLRRVAQVFGWRVDWNGADLEAVVR